MFSVTKNGVPLDSSKYDWNDETKTFSTNENNLVLDFSNYNGVTFKTGCNCTFKTGSYCIFDTRSYCAFDTGSYCAFKTGPYCAFNTGSDCTFNTCSRCTFKTGSKCVVVRHDMFEVIQLKDGVAIKLNEYGVPGFVEIPKSTIS